MSNRQKPGSKVDEYLKSNIDINNPLEKESEVFSQEEHKEVLKKKLLEDPNDLKYVSMQWKERMSTRFHTTLARLQYFRSKRFKRRLYEYGPICLFFGFSCYIIWKMEAQYDNMKRKVLQSKSFKQLEIEQENELIKRQLSRGINDDDDDELTEIDEGIRYKFEEDTELDDAQQEEEDIMADEDEHEKFLQKALSQAQKGLGPRGEKLGPGGRRGFPRREGNLRLNNRNE